MVAAERCRIQAPRVGPAGQFRQSIKQLQFIEFGPDWPGTGRPWSPSTDTVVDTDDAAEKSAHFQHFCRFFKCNCLASALVVLRCGFLKLNLVETLIKSGCNLTPEPEGRRQDPIVVVDVQSGLGRLWRHGSWARHTGQTGQPLQKEQQTVE